MKNITVNVPIVYVGLLLLFGLAVCDVSLLVRAFHQRTMMETAVSGQLPAEGQVLPTLRGFAEKSGNPIEINAGEAPHFALLVFREGCHYCNDNWDSWDK